MLAQISFNSSSKSTSSAFSVKDVMTKWGTNTIASCVLGISRIGWASDIINKISHSAILLLNKSIDYNRDEDEKIQEEIGILIEYGDYSPNMCSKEKKFVENGLVKYHYGNKGGLRYYGKKYSEFIKVFGDMGYIDLNIHVDYQISFNVFLEKVAKVNDNKWVKENYCVGLSNNFNCQDFVIESLKQLRPYFTFANIFPKSSDLIQKKTYNKKLEFVPENIKKELDNFYKKI